MSQLCCNGKLTNENNEIASWSDIDRILQAQESPEERIEYNLQLKGRGGPSNRASIRLFDAPDDFEPEITFYRDSAGL